MNVKKVMAVIAVLAMAFIVSASASAADDDAVDSDIIYIEGNVTAQITSTAEQKIIIEKNVTIKAINGYVGQIISYGELVIKEGATVTIEDGSFCIYGDSIINGNIVSEVANGLTISPSNDCSISINGTVTASRDTDAISITPVTINSDISDKSVVVYGSLVIGTDTNVNLSGVYFERGSELTVLGTVAGAIYGAGHVTINGSVASFAITLAEASAVVDIVSVDGTVTITDRMMLAYDYGGVHYYVGQVAPYEPAGGMLGAIALKYDADNETFYNNDHMMLTVASNTIFVSDAENIKVTETVVTAIAYDEDASMNRMYAETKMSIAAYNSAQAVEGTSSCSAITTTSGKTVCLQTMTLQDIQVTLGGDSAIVEGDVMYPLQDGSFGFTNFCSDVLRITGTLTIVDADSSESVLDSHVNAAHYSETITDGFRHHYTTLQNAISLGATSIDVMGKLTVGSNITVPSTVSLVTDQDEDVSVLVKAGVTFTIANGVQFVDQSTIEVEGTFIIENIASGVTVDTEKIEADYTVEDGSYRVWTSDPSYFGTLSVKCSDTAWYGRGYAEITLSIDSNPGFSSLRFSVQYNGSMMTLVDAVSADLIGMTGGEVSDNPYGMYFEASVAGEDTTATGLLVTLRFSMDEGIGEGTYPITIVSAECFKDCGNPIAVSQSGGSIVVELSDPGDINGDGKVNGLDSLLLRKYITGWSVTIKGNPDVDGDGSVGTSDSLLLKRYLAGCHVVLY